MAASISARLFRLPHVHAKVLSTCTCYKASPSKGVDLKLKTPPFDGRDGIWMGIVNDQFCHIQALRSVEEPDYVVKLINKYFIDVEEILSEIASHCHHLDIDYPKLISLVQQVKERSSHIGAEHVRLACADLIQAGHQMQKQNFILTLNWIKREFSETKSKLVPIVQMERKIMRLENKQCK